MHRAWTRCPGASVLDEVLHLPGLEQALGAWGSSWAGRPELRSSAVAQLGHRYLGLRLVGIQLMIQVPVDAVTMQGYVMFQFLCDLEVGSWKAVLTFLQQNALQ